MKGYIMGKYHNFDHSIIDIANDFYEAYKGCIEGKNFRTDEYGRQTADVVNVPAIVNGVFACELYLKSMLPAGTTGHDIEELFKQIPAEKSAQIKRDIEAKLDLQFHAFNDCLHLLANSFSFWRYIHEKADFGELGLNGTLRVLPAFLETLKEYGNS